MTHTITAAAYDGDIVSRLRHWRGLHLAHSGRLFEEAADTIERLRLSSISAAGNTLTAHATPGEGSVPERCTLTDAEREAIANMIHLIECRYEDYGKDAHHLRALLERLPT